MSEEYQAFLQSKRKVSVDCGFDVSEEEIHPGAFPFQRAIIRWAVKKGRAAILAGTGLGKTIQQLEFSRLVHEHTGRNVLILAPLGVAKQTVREGEKWGVTVRYALNQSEVQSGITITNYERLGKFDREAFGAIVLDESSCLKGYGSVIRKQINEFSATLPYRLACTATPAPNDLIEIINHAEFLGVMEGKEIIALYFTQDGNSSSKMRLKGHARKDFWRWMASWSVAMRKPSDLGFEDGGYNLPPLEMHQVTVEAPPPSFSLFAVEALTLQERQAARRESTEDRVTAAAELVNASDEPWILWCNLNRESEALAKAIPGAVEITGSDSQEHKERSMLDFADGKIRVLVTKPSIAGHGMNFQVCRNVAFVGLSDSWEEFFQAIRRCWRFGQTKPVHCYVITAETEGAVLKNIERKEEQATQMIDSLIKETAGLSLDNTDAGWQEMDYKEGVARGRNWELYLGDCVTQIDRIETASIGLSIFSPPFPGMYAYTNSVHDIGNTVSFDQMLDQFRFLVRPDKLRRVMKPGRTCAVHLMQVPAKLSTDGYIGLKDYRGKTIAMMEEEGWIYFGEACIEKSQHVQASRNHDRAVLYVSAAKDSAICRPALSDYLLLFHAPGANAVPIPALTHPRYNPNGGWMKEEEFDEWAGGVWYRQRPTLPGGIRAEDVLNVRQARDTDDERHLAPLQLGVIERAVKMWSNPGETVLSPFAGIGSEGYQSLLFGRKFVGIELKESYFRTAVENLTTAERKAGAKTLFSLLDDAEEDERGEEGIAATEGVGSLDAAVA